MSGVGKTTTAAVLVEEMIRAGHQVVIVDPAGAWWGLRSSADGKAPGLPVVILGGDHGDVPLPATSGAMIAEIVVDSRQSMLLDLSALRRRDQRTFVRAFAEELYARKQSSRQPVHLVFDEIDVVAPQRRTKGDDPLLDALNDLMRRGRLFGIGMTLITQREAVVDKDLLEMIGVLVAHRCGGPRDRAAIGRWVGAQGSPEERKRLMQSLPSLDVGQAWFFAPAWHGGLCRRVKVRPRDTFDSSKTPTAGEAASAPTASAPVDLAALRDRLAALEASPNEAGNGAALDAAKRRIARLEQELAAARTAPALSPELTRRLLDLLGAMLREIGGVVPELQRALAPGSAEVPARSAAPPARGAPEPKRRPLRAARSASTAPEPKRSREEPALKAGIMKMLALLAQFHRGLTRVQLGTLSGFVARKGTFTSYLSVLKRGGLAEEDAGVIRATPAGIAQAPPNGEALTAETLRAFWFARLKAGERKMLEIVLAAPVGLSRDELAAQAGVTAGGTFTSYFSKLRRNDLVIEAGTDVRPGPAFDVFASH